MTEAELRQRIIRRTGQLSHVVVFQLTCREVRGWPDLVIIGPAAVLFRELKARGKLSPQQRWTGERMLAAGLDFAIWRPADWESGMIDNQLRTAWSSICQLKRCYICAVYYDPRVMIPVPGEELVVCPGCLKKALDRL